MINKRRIYEKNSYYKIFIFLFLIIIFSLFVKTYVTSGNPASRFATIEMVVEQNTFIIDNSTFMGDAKAYDISEIEVKPLMRRDDFQGVNGTNDKAFIDGYFYSDKPVISSIIGVPFYWILFNIFNLSFSNNGAIVVFILTFFLAVIPGALIGVFLFKTLLLFKLKEKKAMLLALSGALSTLIFTYSVTFNNHLLSAFFITIIIYIIFNLKINKLDVKNKKISLIIIGFLASLNLFSDLVSGGIFFVLLCIYLFLEPELRKHLLYFVIGFVPIAILHSILTISITGDILPPSVHSEFWEYEGSNFDADSLSGTSVKHNLKSFLIYGFHLIFGYRGFLLYSPILIFGIIEIFRRIKNKDKFRNEGVLMFVFAIVVIGYYSVFTDNFGGWSYGIRWFVPLIPGLFIFSAMSFEKISLFQKKLFYLFLVWSFLFAVVGAFEPWTDMWFSEFSFINNLRELLRLII